MMTDLPRYPDLADASVLVTGGASGIGAALVDGFARQGAKVALIDLADGTALADALAAEGAHRPLPLQANLTDHAALSDALDAAAEAHGPITVLVNNAADDVRSTVEDITPEAWDASLAVNLNHLFFAAQKLAPGMAAAGGGSIVNYSSITYRMGFPNLVPYVTAKAGIVGMTRSLARAWGPEGIRVNAISPGMILTEKQLASRVSEDDIARFQEKQALKRRLWAEDLVGPTLFLASKASGAITGQVLGVDGGAEMIG